MRKSYSFFLFFGFSGLLLAHPLKEGWQYKGYINISYNYLLRRSTFFSGAYNRMNDINLNGITLQQFAVTAFYEPADGFGWVFNPIFGRDAYTLAPEGWDPDLGSPWYGFFIAQAALQYQHNETTVAFGQLLTLSGQENVDVTTNYNFSDSILNFYLQPSTTLGLRVTQLMSKNWTLFGGVNNGWDDITDFGRPKTIELGAINQWNRFFSTNLILTSGGERAIINSEVGPIGMMHSIDWTGNLLLNDHLRIILNWDYVYQDTALLPSGVFSSATGVGAALYVNYKMNTRWQATARGEIFNDNEGYATGITQVWKEVTITLGYIPKENIQIRLEARHDWSNKDAFVNPSTLALSNHQQSLSISGVFIF